MGTNPAFLARGWPVRTQDRVTDILRAAGTAAFVVGLLVLMLNPPTLTGAEEAMGAKPTGAPP